MSEYDLFFSRHKDILFCWHVSTLWNLPRRTKYIPLRLQYDVIRAPCMRCRYLPLLLVPRGWIQVETDDASPSLEFLISIRRLQMWWWWVWDVWVEGGRLGTNVWRMIWRCLVCLLNGQCSGICGGASFREERLTLAEHGETNVLNVNDDDDEPRHQPILNFYISLNIIWPVVLKNLECRRISAYW